MKSPWAFIFSTLRSCASRIFLNFSAAVFSAASYVWFSIFRVLSAFLFAVCFGVVQKSAGAEDFPLAFGEGETERKLCAACLILERYRIRRRDRVRKAGDDKLVALLDFVIIPGIFKGERYDAEIDEICHMDAGEALRDDGFHAEIERHERRMLA